ncbi:helix-turn-helix transcriptional regulator [Haloarchaeobius iranensis]|uniref:Predicted transcriptional regulator, contains HTH domain n=1 Tax=Haloarchaeobius iranensis TaxID=996166 RepID=A0A1G9SAY0_9EURY|nr:helix-turn-helix domain-containing protein [Haloarchaeobius iranensis]SDM32638.1 Predicted transcriptional regulator, contains HTH domain [Haloarchaeobius iranensis]
MDRDAVDDAVALLQRAPVLAACRDGPTDRTTLAERAGVSRATAYRATNALTERGLLEREPEGYRLTGLGRAVLAHVESLDEGLTGTRTLAPVLARVDAPELVANTHLFTDATVLTADPSTPYRIDQALATIVGDTSEAMVGVTASFGSPTVMERTYEVLQRGVPVEWVLTPAAFEGVRTQHPDGHDELMAMETTATYLVEDPPLDIAIYDDTLVIPGYDDESGAVTAVATTEDPDALAWARGVFDACRERAEPLD